MKIITIAIQKGGTGKTATAAAIASAASAKGMKCLAVDLDPQANLSYCLGAAVSNRPGSYELLQGMNPAEIIQTRGCGLDIIPASWALSTMTSTTGSARRLSNALQPLLPHYDIVVIDTPPTAGECQYNALQAATDLLIPMQADAFSLQALYQIAATAHQFQGSNPSLKIAGIILTQYSSRSLLSRAMEKKIEKAAEDMGLPVIGRIRQGVAVREAAAMQQPLFEYAPRAKPAADYMALFNVLTRQA